MTYKFFHRFNVTKKCLFKDTNISVLTIVTFIWTLRQGEGTEQNKRYHQQRYTLIDYLNNKKIKSQGSILHSMSSRPGDIEQVDNRGHVSCHESFTIHNLVMNTLLTYSFSVVHLKETLLRHRDSDRMKGCFFSRCSRDNWCTKDRVTYDVV